METVAGAFASSERCPSPFLTLTEYRIIGKKGEGTFSEVIKCQSLADGNLCAAKRMKGKFSRFSIQLFARVTVNSVEQINNLREVQALRRLHNHPNIIKLLDVI